MKILQLCCFTNLWGLDHEIESIDLKTGSNLFNYPYNYGKNFDLVCAAPPCTQFTKANNHNWLNYPHYDVKLAQLCFAICLSSGGFWFLENPPGRIELFLPGLTKFRVLTWSGNVTNKEYVLYSNFLLCVPFVQRYGKKIMKRKKMTREAWQPDFINSIIEGLQLSGK